MESTETRLGIASLVSTIIAGNAKRVSGVAANTGDEALSIARQYMEAGQIVREAECPFGHGPSREFVGPTEDGWVFRCDRKTANRHNFVAEPDPKAPETVEEVLAWMKRHQRVAKKKVLA